ncbi:MAG: hypothetical protein ABI811_00205 [Acidobacteriota bacterium]
MRSKALGAVVVIQFVVICALGLLLVQGRRPTAERERVKTALADIRGALSVGANYTQFQEKVQALAAAIENFRSQGGAGNDLARFEQSQKLYKDSLDLWSDELSYPGLYESERRRFVPTPLERIAKEQGLDLSEPKVPYKIFADELLQQLWKKADQAGSGVNPQKESAPEPTQPKK